MSIPKNQKTTQSYELLYHPGIPGRGEFIRLVFEATSTPYLDVGNASEQGYSVVQAICSPDQPVVSGNNYPIFSPPALRIIETPLTTRAGQSAGDPSSSSSSEKQTVIHQTPAILAYLGPKLGLSGSTEEEAVFVQQVALTALDLANEAHDTHHPIAVSQTYEDQKAAALQKAEAFRRERIPKFLAYFTHVLSTNKTNTTSNGNGNDNDNSKGKQYLVGTKLSYADTTVWHVLDGLHHAFPHEMKARTKEYPALLETWYLGLRREEGWLDGYMRSERRLAYSMGIFRHYEELDRA